MLTQSSKKKNQNLAALLSDDAEKIEKVITRGAADPENGGSDKGAMAQIKPAPDVNPASLQLEPEPETAALKDDPRMALEEELGLPKAFTRVFKKSGRYEKAPKTTTLVYVDILSHYRTLSEKMDVDTVVLVNNVLAEWYNKHLDVVDRVVNRKMDVKAL